MCSCRPRTRRARAALSSRAVGAQTNRRRFAGRSNECTRRALLARAASALAVLPDVLLVDATGQDHPRRAGLALHLGAALDAATVGVTHRPLLARGAWPPDVHGATSPLLLDGERVGAWLRTRPGTRPLAVHAAWRTDAYVAVEIVRSAIRAARTPEPLRIARRAAREVRAADSRRGL